MKMDLANSKEANAKSAAITEAKTLQANENENEIKPKKPKLNCQEDSKTRIGDEYQAICPPLKPLEERNSKDLSERALAVWSPTDKLSDEQIQSFLMLASEKYSYNSEQALGMLQWHNHNIEHAIADLEHFMPYCVEWSPEDKKIFEDALLFHGKNFVRISGLVPNKKVSDIIHYYYASKKKGRRQRRSRNSSH